jgi:O-antigen ligase
MPLSTWVRRNPHQAPKIWMLMGFLPFVLGPFHLFMAGISWREWPGFVQGIEFSVLDAVALALFLSMPPAPSPLPFRLSMTFYFLAVLLSTLQARTPITALFYPWQLGRMFVVYAAVTRGVYADSRVAPAVMKGLAAGLFVEAGVAIWQRFGLGVLQAYGTFDAQNLLGLSSHFIVFPFFAMLLRGPFGWLPVTVVLAGIIVEVLTVSRATLGLAGLGFAMISMFSIVRQWTSRKLFALLAGAVIMAIVSPLVLLSLEQRDNEALSNRDRESFLRAAAAIFSDHPWGIGSNQYVVVANAEGYDEKAHVQPYSRESLVHNVYWLVATETGFLGLFAFVLLLLRPLTVAFFCAWRNRGDPSGDLLLGLGGGLLIAYIHSFFEWIFVLSVTQYIFAMEVGLVAGLACRLGYWRPYRKLPASSRQHQLSAKVADGMRGQQYRGRRAFGSAPKE